ncbi:IS1 family transposase [Bacteroides heparinolyticus]|uniref:IS1 family transposase n=1 Tax=Prevotella heparinolytica TaxID=28113 RepID=UPI00359F6712
MNCPKCKSELKVKNGVIKGVQRYKCKDCNCNYTVSFQQQSEKEKKRRFALSLYLEGLGFHSIGRLLGVSHVSVLNWVRKYGRELTSIRNPRPVKIMELDEIHSYCGNKKTTVGYGLVLIENNANTLISMWETEAQKQG